MKKKRIVKLEPQTVELFAEVLSKLRPPPPLTVSQWADRYRVLSAESSAEPGRWHTEKAPYQRAIMDAIGDPHVRSVVVMSAAQIGKTDAFILNPLGYYMDYAPCPVMCMQPTLDMGQTLSKDRIAPMIRDTPRLTGLVDTKSRYAGNTVMKKNFPGGHITIVGANSPSSLASRPIKVLLADEIDRYPKSAGTEGDPLDLAKKRQTTFWDYKTVMVSTPTIKGDSRIEDAYLLSTQEEWNVPCPECGAWHKADGTAYPLLATCIDSGGHHTDEVYRFAKERLNRRIFAIKGMGGAGVPFIRNPSKNNRVRADLFILGVDAGKTTIYQRLEVKTPGPNYCHFPSNEEAGYTEEYFKGLTAEKKVVRFVKGHLKEYWEIKDKEHKRNEPLDLRNYATAALAISRPVLKKPDADGTPAQPVKKSRGRRQLSGGI